MKYFFIPSCISIMLTTFASSAVFASELAAFSVANSAVPPAPWHFVGLPERFNKPRTQFEVTDLEGKKVLKVSADKAYGNLVHPWASPVSTLTFKWRLDKALEKASLKSKATEDIALKVCLSFDMPINHIPALERAKFKLAQVFSDQALPTATLCYIWAHAEQVGTEQTSPYTSRVHYIVLNTGESQLKTWQEHKRNVSVDFIRAYGTESSVLPAVTAIIIGADSDNTQGASLAYVTDISMQP
jgi:Protein of unknown function (DUF3047)